MGQGLRDHWERLWSDPSFAPPWANRDVSPEMVHAVETGWLPPRGSILDIGCGTGEAAAWFAKSGYSVTGVDIAKHAVAIARQRHSAQSGLEFRQLDICAQGMTDGAFDIIIDRGCFHQIAERDLPIYVENVSASAADDARMLLFIRAYRAPGSVFGNRRETEFHCSHVAQLFRGQFRVDSWRPTNLVGVGEKPAERHLPGIVLRLVRARP